MLLRTCAALFALFVPAHVIADERPPAAQHIAQRGPFVEAIANLRRIRTPHGIEELRQVKLGGVDQWISIRGRDRANPVLLMLHGGPGTPMMQLSWAYQNDWEDYFTVVNWDQRGTGKNWQTTNAEDLAKTMSLNRIVTDASELVDYLRQYLGKRKIIVLGFSYGSEIGVKLAMKRPEAIAVYAAVGQVFDDGEKEVYRGAIQRAQEAGDEEALAALRAMAPYPPPEGPKIQQLVQMRKWAKKFNGGWYGWLDLQLLYQLPVLSPEYDAKDVADWPEGNSWFGLSLGSEVGHPNLAEAGYEFKVPVVFLMGRHDLMTPYVHARTYFNRIVAPSKHFETFENSAHFVMLEEPGRFFLALVNYVRPYAAEEDAH